MYKNAQQLPPWFKSPQPLTNYQVSLFPPKLPAVLAQLRVSLDELSRWHNKGWISFAVSDTEDLEKPRILEITFVRDVVRSGLPDAYIEELLSQLPRPLTLNPLAVAFSFSLGWVEVARLAPADTIEKDLEPWLEDLLEEDDTDRLNNMVELFEDLIERVKEKNWR